MNKIFIIVAVLFVTLLTTCRKKEEVLTPKNKKPEICDFGALDNNISSIRLAPNTGTTRFKDSDKDGVPDIRDNCPKVKNTNQIDTDGDGIGDVCDPYPYGNEPTAASVILLDFDGYYLNSPMWNYGVPYNCTPSGLYPADIQTILDSVSKDYSKFNVVVTTDENVYLKASTLKRMRVVITTSSEVYPGVAGIAYVSSMFWGDNTPCFVFSNTMSYNALRIRTAISHESGHTIGLYHQSQYDTNCNLLYTYKPCDGLNGPIMGSIGASCTPLWWIGPTPNGCTFIQDDVAIIIKNAGIK